MPRRTLLNLALGILVAAIAAVLWLAPPREPEPAPLLVPGVDPAAVDAIRVQRSGGIELRFHRSGDAWLMTEPVAAPAHESRINALLGLLTDQSLAQLPATDLARFGLETPPVVVELGPHRIAFGDPHPIDEQRYVLHGGAIHLVPDSLYAQLTQNAGFFIDNHLLPAGVQPVRIHYPAFTLESDAVGWRELPPADRDAGQLRLVIGAWQSARALAVRAPAGAADAQGTITVESGDGKSIVFDIRALQPAPVLVRRDLDVQYHLDALTAGQLLIVPPAAAAKPAD